METESEKQRSEFLIQWYGMLWSNINRSMLGIWQILAPVMAVGTIMAAVDKDYIPLPLGGTLVFIILFWALNMTIDLNKWHKRNLFFLTGVEKEFLRENDYGKIIPARYKCADASWIRFYKVNAWTIISLVVICAVYAYMKGDCSYHWIVFAVAAVLTFKNYNDNKKSIERHVSELFTKTRTPR